MLEMLMQTTGETSNTSLNPRIKTLNSSKKKPPNFPSLMKKQMLSPPSNLPLMKNGRNSWKNATKRPTNSVIKDGPNRLKTSEGSTTNEKLISARTRTSTTPPRPRPRSSSRSMTGNLTHSETIPGNSTEFIETTYKLRPTQTALHNSKTNFLAHLAPPILPMVLSRTCSPERILPTQSTTRSSRKKPTRSLRRLNEIGAALPSPHTHS